MRCCVPFCENTAENVNSQRITFHGFPTGPYLCSPWLKALGKQNSQLSESTMVCSQHFLNDDIYETGNGLRLIHIGAVPSTVQICMMCLDTESNMFLISKYNLTKAYEDLTGHTLCNVRNLKQTLCVECAQRLVNFKRFRDKSLRARSLMMDLVKEHEFITMRHFKSLDRVKEQLSSNISSTILEADHCDLHIVYEDKQTEIDETVVVKEEDEDDSTMVGGRKKIKVEIFLNVSMSLIPTLKCSASSQKLCYFDLIQSEPLAASTSRPCARTYISRSTLISDNEQSKKKANKDPPVYNGRSLAAPLPVTLGTSNENSVRPSETTDVIEKNKEVLENNNIGRSENTATKRLEIIYDGFGTQQKTRTNENQSLTIKQESNSLGDSESEINANVSEDFNNQTRQRESISSNSESNVISKNLAGRIRARFKKSTEKRQYRCDVCQSVYHERSLLIQHIESHNKKKSFNCQFCQYKCKYNSVLVIHMRTHTGEKPFACEFCRYKCIKNSDLVRHMRTHTGEKPFSCKQCDYKCIESSSLVKHIRTHSGEKPYSCKLCAYRCARNGDLASHMRTHTGEKPYSCKYCDYKCAHNSTFVSHMRSHTGEKPFSCKLCHYRCSHSGALLSHMKTHAGKK